VSNAGAPLRVRCKVGLIDLANAGITVNGKQVAVQVDENGIVTIPCAKGDVVKIDFTREETAISQVVAEQVKDNTIYDLSGRKLNKAPEKGVYIQGGTKKFVK
jgi:hypothetical protein